MHFLVDLFFCLVHFCLWIFIDAWDVRWILSILNSLSDRIHIGGGRSCFIYVVVSCYYLVIGIWYSILDIFDGYFILCSRLLVFSYIGILSVLYYWHPISRFIIGFYFHIFGIFHVIGFQLSAFFLVIYIYGVGSL